MPRGPWHTWHVALEPSSRPSCGLGLLCSDGSAAVAVRRLGFEELPLGAGNRASELLLEASNRLLAFEY